MAQPNIVSVANLYGKTLGASLTTSSADILTNAAASSKALKIENIVIANVSASIADVTVYFYDASATTSFRLAYQITIPSKASLELISRCIYLEEGDKIQALSSIASSLDIVVSYEEIS